MAKHRVPQPANTMRMLETLLACQNAPKVEQGDNPLHAKLDEPTYGDRLAERRPVRRWQRRTPKNAGASNATSTVRPDAGNGGRGWVYSRYGAVWRAK